MRYVVQSYKVLKLITHLPDNLTNQIAHSLCLQVASILSIFLTQFLHTCRCENVIFYTFLCDLALQFQIF